MYIWLFVTDFPHSPSQDLRCWICHVRLSYEQLNRTCQNLCSNWIILDSKINSRKNKKRKERKEEREIYKELPNTVWTKTKQKNRSPTMTPIVMACTPRGRIVMTNIITIVTMVVIWRRITRRRGQQQPYVLFFSFNQNTRIAERAGDKEQAEGGPETHKRNHRQQLLYFSAAILIMKSAICQYEASKDI